MVLSQSHNIKSPSAVWQRDNNAPTMSTKSFSLGIGESHPKMILREVGGWV